MIRRWSGVSDVVLVPMGWETPDHRPVATAGVRCYRGVAEVALYEDRPHTAYLGEEEPGPSSALGLELEPCDKSRARSPSRHSAPWRGSTAPRWTGTDAQRRDRAHGARERIWVPR
ncbi:MAG: hypothetical protein R2716_11420 [Microthrixaceae bacterium]